MVDLELVSKADMIEAGHAAELGEGLNLDRLFVQWQSIGLLGRPVTRAPRRGGEGLWHPNQMYLWLDLLHFRTREGRRVPTLTNLPVAAWRLGEEGIETEQAQRAYGYWDSQLDNPNRPKGERSLRREAIEVRVQWLASPEASASAKRRLRRLLEMANDSAPRISVSPDTLARAALDVIAPGRKPTDLERVVARSLYEQIVFTSAAHDCRDALLASTPETRAFWEWARRLGQADLAEAAAAQPAFREAPGIGRLYTPISLDEFTSQACLGLMTILGIGVRRLLGELDRWPPKSEPPPPLHNLKRKTS